MEKRILGDTAALEYGDAGHTRISELFHENTKLYPGLPEKLWQNTYSWADRRAMSAAFTRYVCRQRIILPKVQSNLGSPSFDEVMLRRRSTRQFEDATIDLAALSDLLFHSYGITGEEISPDGIIQKFRAAPSAGALYPAEIYLWPRRVEGLTPALYHYDVYDHALEMISECSMDSLYDACCKTPFVCESAISFLISGVIDRTCRKYGDRGYRYLLLDIGHMVQNLCLATASQNLAIVTSCGFYDEYANKLLGLDGLHESVFYTAFVGLPSSTDC